MINRLSRSYLVLTAMFLCGPHLLARGEESASPLLHDVDHPVHFAPQFKDRAAWEDRARALREQLEVALGLFPRADAPPLKPVIYGKIERDGYTIEKVFFASMPGHYVSGNLYRPTTPGAHAAVLSPHGHWPNGRFLEVSDVDAREQIAMGAEKTLASAKYPLQARCAMLARMGCVVFHYDMVGYADSQSIAHRAGFTDVEAILRLQSFMGLQTLNSIRALDFLCSLPDVDPTRVAVTGASGGGTQTMMLCAIDSRPRVSFPAVMVSEAMQGGCICENAPLLRVGTNNAEIAALFAPKPLGMTSAKDWTEHLLTEGYPQIQQIYRLYGTEARVAAWHREFPHNYNQVSRELMYNFLNEHLKLGVPGPIVEKPFQPVPPAELSVYDAAHPRPADSLDAAHLREEMTKLSDGQMQGLRVTERFRRIAKPALRVMLCETSPAPATIDVTVEKSSPPDGPHRESQALSRHGDPTGAVLVTLLAPGEKLEGRPIVVWAALDDRSAALDAKGEPTPAVRRLLDAGHVVLVPVLTGPGEVDAQGRAILHAKYGELEYGGYDFGYNPSLLARRTQRLITTLRYARQLKPARLSLIGLRRGGVIAALARTQVEPTVDLSLLDLDHFEFTQVREMNDPMLLPGGLKYLGMAGVMEIEAGERRLWKRPDSVWMIPASEARAGDASADAMVTDLLAKPEGAR